MEIVAVKAAGWVVGKALGAVTGTLLEAWAASKGLGPKVDALKVELLYAQAMLDNTQGREIHSPALKELLLRLQQLAYSADDVLDEIEYFRIQDELDSTYHAADAHAGGCVRDLILNARHVAGAVAAKLKPSCGSRHGHTIGEHDEQDRHGCLSSVVCCSCGGGTVSSSPPSPTNQDDQNKVHGGCMQKLASNASTAACPGKCFISSRAGRLPVSVDNCVHTLTYPRFPTQQEMDEDSSPVLPCLPR
jgi:hypothetical protein